MSDTFITLMAILAYSIGWVLYFAGAVHSLKWECSADLCSVQDRFRQDDWGGAWQWVQGICRVQGNSWHANQRKNRKNYLITFPRFLSVRLYDCFIQSYFLYILFSSICCWISPGDPGRETRLWSRQGKETGGNYFQCRYVEYPCTHAFMIFLRNK